MWLLQYDTNFQKQKTYIPGLKFIRNCNQSLIYISSKLTVINMSAVDKCQLLCCVLLLCGKRDWCVAITSFLGGLSAVAMLCGNVCGLSYVTVSNLSLRQCHLTCVSSVRIPCLLKLALPPMLFCLLEKPS